MHRIPRHAACRALLIALLLPALLSSPGWARNAAAAPRSVPRKPRKASAQSGVHVRLRAGQTIASLARAYDVPVATLLEVNRIADPTRIPAGTRIFIPGAPRVLEPPRSGEALLSWPLRGRITTSFNEGTEGRHHEGIDIDGEMGQPIRAAAEGMVIEARTDGKYGNSIRIDHGNGLTTFYAHASKLLVQEGERVRRGEIIAEVGSTGNARGTHLHFETRRAGQAVDPMGLLKDVELAGR